MGKHSELPVSITNNANITQTTTNNNATGALLGQKTAAKILLEAETKGQNNQTFKTIKDKSKLKSQRTKQPNKYTQVVTLKTWNSHYRGGRKKKNYSKYNRRNFTRPKFSVAGAVKSGWEEVEEMNVTKRQEVELDWEMETLDTVGKMYQFNGLFESKLNAKNTLLLKRASEEYSTQTGAFKDPYLLNLVFNQKEDDDKKVFYMDSNVFSTLAALPKSKFPFNINFTKQNNKYAIDVDYEESSAA